MLFSFLIKINYKNKYLKMKRQKLNKTLQCFNCTQIFIYKIILSFFFPFFGQLMSICQKNNKTKEKSANKQKTVHMNRFFFFC